MEALEKEVASATTTPVGTAVPPPRPTGAAKK